jgi:hypothetical protein
MKKLFSADDARYTIAHFTDDGLVLETKEDVSALVELNKKQFNESDGTFRDPVMTHIARVPATVIDDLNRKGIMRGYQVIDEKRMKAWLNHPDNRFFRTHPGRV